MTEFLIAYGIGAVTCAFFVTAHASYNRDYLTADSLPYYSFLWPIGLSCHIGKIIGEWLRRF